MELFNQSEAAQVGIYLPGVKQLYDSTKGEHRPFLAADAQPAMVTNPSSGFPSYLYNLMDTEVIRVLMTPMKAAEIMGGDEAQKGTWIDDTAQFPIIESTGETTGYGDWNEVGSAGFNVNWEDRESFLFQVITQWGDKEMEKAARAGFDVAGEKNRAAADVLSRFRNNSYFYGVAGKKLYGLLNDPSLPASILPNTKTAGGTTWAAGTSDENYSDVVKLFAQLVTQTRGLVDRETPMTLAMSPQAEANFTKTNQFGINTMDLLVKNFPNMKVKTAPQYATPNGGFVQLIVNSFNGTRVALPAYNERMRAHPVVTLVSSWKQKKTSGTWGAIIRQPLAIASMLGV